MAQFKKQATSCFLFRDVTHFLTPSEVVDYHIGIATGLSLQAALSMLEQGKYSLPPLAAIFAMVFNKNAESQSFQVNPARMCELINNDGVKLLIGGLEKLLGVMLQKQGASLQNEMALKVLLNLIYICVDYLEHDQKNQSASKQLNVLYKDARLDDTLMKMVTLSLEAHFIPIKKLAILYTRVLANLFHHREGENSTIIHPVTLYSDSLIATLPHNNLLRYGELEKYKLAHPPPTGPVFTSKPISPIEHFYRKHNTGECPLAQSIVVGLLRSLLTVCNCQGHKRFQTVKGSGVDSFREWQLSYRYALDRPQLLAFFPSQLVAHLKLYEAFDQVSNEGRAVKPQQQPIWTQFYSHKIYATAAITCFFQFMLVALHQNMFMQYSYFLQLISDANGILVFLKFLTDKFSGLDQVRAGSPFRAREQRGGEFKEEVMMTIYGVLLMLFTSCNNYPEKIRNYLFQYNSYLIIKKIPSLFLRNEEDLQSSQTGMPSRQEVELHGSDGTLRTLTELCYDLLKIQIPFFSKKMKENSANMRMIIDIYCKYPRTLPPQVLSPLDKLLLKSKSGLVKQEKFITSVQEMKTIHNEYNNLYYWSNDFLQEHNSSPPQLLLPACDGIDPQHWLQQNLWKYYD